MNLTTGERDNPLPSKAPVSRNGKSAPGGTVIGDLFAWPGWLGPEFPPLELDAMVEVVAIVAPGVKPLIVVVVVVGGNVVVVVVVVVVSTGTPGTVVVVVVGGVFTTLTANEYPGSVINITTARLLYTSVILPIMPAALRTGIPTLMPHSEPRLISTV